MKYDKYREGLESLRQVLYTNDAQNIAQFGKYHIYDNRGNRERFKVIWNAKADNVVAAMNRKGVVFVRPNSIYAGQLLASKKHRVVLSNNLQRFRGMIPGHIKVDILANMYASDITTKLAENDDRPRTFTVAKIRREPRISADYMAQLVMLKVVDHLAEKLPNTMKSLANHHNFTYTVTEDDPKIKVQFTVQDFSAELQREERLNEAKKSILAYMVANYEKLRDEEAIVNSAGNPTFFRVSYELDGVRYVAVVDARPVRQVFEGVKTIEEVSNWVELKPFSIEEERNQQTTRSMESYARRIRPEFNFNNYWLDEDETYGSLVDASPGVLRPVYHQEFTTSVATSQTTTQQALDREDIERLVGDL